jgi:ABC transporter ATM
VPFFFKHAVDALSIDPTGATTAPYLGMVHLAPTALLLGYGAARAGAAFCGEMRNVVFAKVSQSAVRRVANQVFEHLHRLDLQFHLDRQTGKVVVCLCVMCCCCVYVALLFVCVLCAAERFFVRAVGGGSS